MVKSLPLAARARRTFRQWVGSQNVDECRDGSPDGGSACVSASCKEFVWLIMQEW